MYNPAPPPVGSPYTADDFEFIELQNISTGALNISGYAFSNGITFAFPTMAALTAGQRVVVAKNPTAFATRYSTAGMILLGPYTGVLNNAGERITLLGSVGETVQNFEYSDGWYPQTDGEGFSLVIRDTAQALALWNDKDGWRVSTSKNGGPGLADIGYNPGAVIINEVLAHTKMDSAPDYGDWIELKNTTTAAINLGGWFLSDDPLQLDKYRIPDGTILPAGGPDGYIVFSQLQHFGVGANAFALSELGDTACLTAPAADGTPGGYRESQSFGASDREISMGLHTKSTGGTDFVQLASKTRGAANSLPLVGGFLINQTEVYAGDLINPGIIINEVMYHPATFDGDEFIELRNLSASAVKLYDPLHPENRWKFTEGIAPSGVPFVLPAVEIPAYGYALVVPIDPATFRTKYGISASVLIFGPYTPGVLSNEGDSIELQKPGTPHADGTVPYYRVDRVTYNDKLPWPVRADGGGSSLIRLVSTNYGNDVANWDAGTTGGTPGADNRGLDTTPPTTPGSLTATVAGAAQIDISWAAATDPESGIGVYRIYRNNIPIAECATTVYHDTNAKPAVTYTYQVAAVNRDGVEGARSTSVTARIIALQSAATANIITVQAVFSEAVTQASAENKSNYAITYPTSQQVTILGAFLEADGKTVSLTVASPLAYDTMYTLTVSNVASTTGTLIWPNSQAAFQFSATGTGTILRQYWTGISGTAVSDLTGNANFPNNPSGSNQQTSFEAPTDWADSYGTRMRGYVTAPVSGTYVFWIASDDNSELWLNPNGEDPAGKVKIAWVGGWTGPRAWSQEGNQCSSNVYITITLQANHRYYIEALQKEGSGGDNLAVGWQLPDGTLERPIPGIRLTPYGAAPAQTVSIAATDPDADEQGPDPGTFTVTRTGTTTSALRVYYTVAGTARSSEYTPSLSGFVDMAANVTTASVTITPIDDMIPGHDETVSLILKPSTDCSINGNGLATVTIADNDVPTVSVAATTPDASEAGPTKGVFTFTRVGDLAGSLTVNYAVTGGTASPSDYQSLAGSVTFATGQATATVDLMPVNDSEDEPAETVILTITPNASAYLIGTPASATVTIADNDVPTVSVAATQPNASETGPTDGIYTFTRVGDLTAALTVSYSVTGGTASPEDYNPLAGSVAFVIGQATATVNLTPVDDTIDEPAETVILTITPNASEYLVGSPSSATVFIADNDLPIVSVAATTADASEAGPTKGVYTFTRVGDTTVALTVNYAVDTANSTASSSDYLALAGFVTFQIGQTTVTVDLMPVDDTIDEPTETVVLKISPNASAYLVGGTGSAAVYILDNDLPTVRIMTADRYASEQGPDKGIFRFVRIGDLSAALTVYYHVDPSSTASSSDYQPLDGFVTFQAGQSTLNLDLIPVDDLEDEPTETVTLVISPNPEYLIGAPISPTVFISDNDLPTVSVAATTADASEAGPTKGVYTSGA
jgi:fibronectin type 3 domain-containing protein